MSNLNDQNERISPETLEEAARGLGARMVECSLPDFSSVARGKRLVVGEWVAQQGCRLPSVLLGMSITGGAPPHVFGTLLPKGYVDLHLVPDLATLAPRPGRPGEVTVICDPSGAWWSDALAREVHASELVPRSALKRVLRSYQAQGLRATVAPELEMFLVQRDPAGHALGSARARASYPVCESACDAYSLERCSHFEPYFDELWQACESWGIPVSGYLHEAALSQFEVNFRPGEPLAQADAVFRFKRLAREIAARHGFLASFAAKPYLDQPGTGMHWHFSVQRTGPGHGAWPHLFATPGGEPSVELMHFIAGLQQHAPSAMALLAPFDMSFDRIVLSDASPTHADWGHDDRKVAFRVPASAPLAMRVENRLPGGDANPYLTVASTLGLGLWGLNAGQAALDGKPDGLALPRQLPAALAALESSRVVRDILGSTLVDLFVALKRHEHDERAGLAQPRLDWDLRHLIELA
jgi:glutamine synthetase